MSSQGTSSPSAGQTRFCWMRTPSDSCSWWKRTDFLETALYSFTGTLTRPKLIAPVHIDLGMPHSFAHRRSFIVDDREIAPELYTVGHSTHGLSRFLKLLRAHGIERLGDVRRVPRSRRMPHFAGDALAQSLEAAGIRYQH